MCSSSAFLQSADAQINTNRVSSDLNGIVTAVDTAQGGESVDVSVVDTSAITSINSNINANTIITSTDPNAATNAATMVSENANTLTVTKTDMDTRIFTPNKQYMLSYYYDNPNYCGLYYLVGKTEIYLTTGTDLKSQMTITLKKCADFVNDIQSKINQRSGKIASTKSPTGTLYGNNDI